MNWRGFSAADLADLDARLYSQADRVVPMRDISKGDIGRRVIGLRHDVDDNHGSFETALRMAEWEFDHGYSSTWFLLHGAHYWNDDMLCRAPMFEEMGHEVGLHVNALAEALRQQRDPHMILVEALTELRSAVTVRGCVAHGDGLCRRGDGTVRFVNDEMFLESRRTDLGDPWRVLALNGYSFRIDPVSRDVYGLEYDPNWLPRRFYLSDSGGSWSRPFDEIAGVFGEGQLHMLVHPDWWSRAFAKVAA